MSINCISCVLRRRTQADMLCDCCRELERIKNLRPPRPAGGPDLDWLIEQVERQESLIYTLAGGVSDLQRQTKARIDADPSDIPPSLQCVTIGAMHKAILEYAGKT